MRKREIIEADGTRNDILVLEVLLDIREMLAKPQKKPYAGKPRGRPKKK